MIGSDLALAARLLREGRLVGLPTETVYGLAGNALEGAVVASIFETKRRPHFDPLIVHLPAVAALEQYAHTVPDAAWVLAQAFWPGPLTLLLPRKPLVPDLVTSGLPRAGFRVPAHPMAQALLAALPFPLAAPSANPFGYISPTTAAHVAAQLPEVPYVLDGGPCALGLESTVVGFEENEVVVYRLGALAVEALAAALPDKAIRVRPHSSSRPQAPGMVERHYAPRVPLVLATPEEAAAQARPGQDGWLGQSAPLPGLPPEHQLVLSPGGDLREAAQRLFAALHALDALPLTRIFAELAPREGLGPAINDRLRRAAAQTG